VREKGGKVNDGKTSSSSISHTMEVSEEAVAMEESPFKPVEAKLVPG
jgi:hypothetical protein